ncbi:MAG: GNAT family N-acetyltransferase [Actinobacteria bacterium]|nr:GNAT family N-acetyltransferase [Actinomycetota bacterium]
MSRTSDRSWTVRQATLEDLDGVFDVYAEVAAERVHIGGEPPIDRDARLAKWREHFDRPHHVTFVAVADGRIVGSASITWAGASEIGMAILSEWRGKGIGSALLEALIAWAERDGSHKMELYVWPHNDAAIALYEKFGFEREGYLKRHYRRRNGEIWDCIIMGLQLPRPT